MKRLTLAQAKQIARNDPHGDRNIVMVNDQEMAELKAEGGAGVTNKRTGLKQFYDTGPGGSGGPSGNGAQGGSRGDHTGAGNANGGRKGDNGGRSNSLGGGRVTDSGTQFGGGMSTGGAGLGQSGMGTGTGVDNAAATAARQPGSQIGKGGAFGNRGGGQDDASSLLSDWSGLEGPMVPQINRKAQNVDATAPLTSSQIGEDERLGLNPGESQASYDKRARAAGLSSKGTNSISDRLADFAQNPSGFNTEDQTFNTFGSLLGAIVPGLNLGVGATNLARAITGEPGETPTDTNPDTGNKREMVAADILAGDPGAAPPAPVDDGVYSDVRLQDRRRAGSQTPDTSAVSLDDRLGGTAVDALTTPQARYIPRKRLMSLAA
jgi:hypothetical protein